jgi:hypothetical protein
MRKRGPRLAAAAAFLGGVLSPALLISTASATTGDTYVLPPSQYVVPRAVMAPYYGNYRMGSAAKGSRLYAADIFITQNQYHDMWGGGSFFGYDTTGAQESWTNVLYDFHVIPAAGGAPVRPWTTARQIAHGELIVTLYGWGSPSLGTMRLTRSANGDLSGTIRFLGQKKSYPISFHKLSSHP